MNTKPECLSSLGPIGASACRRLPCVPNERHVLPVPLQPTFTDPRVEPRPSLDIRQPAPSLALPLDRHSPVPSLCPWHRSVLNLPSLVTPAPALAVRVPACQSGVRGSRTPPRLRPRRLCDRLCTPSRETRSRAPSLISASLGHTRVKAHHPSLPRSTIPRSPISGLISTWKRPSS